MPKVYKKTTSTTTMAAGRRKRVMAGRPSRAMVVRGFTRTGGFYKRFTPRGQRFGELKFLDTALGQTAVTQAGAVYTNLNVVAQGDGQSQRIGRKIVIKSIYFKGIVQKDGAAATANTSDTVRIIVIQDKQANGQVFAATDYLDSANYLSHKNLANENRFKCLSDQTFSLSCPSGSYTGAAASFGEGRRTWEKYMRCNIPIEYDTTATTGAIATQRSNSIAVLAISESATISTIQYNCRIRYSD